MAAISGCGDDSEVEPAPQAGTGSAAGSGAVGGLSGTGGSGGSTLPPPPPPVPCGSTMCYAPTSPLSALTGGMMLPLMLPMPVACCVDEAKGQCGTAASSGAACEPPAVPDSRCLGIDLGALGAAAAGLPLGNISTGCCTPNGDCGLDGSIFGRGCVENSAAKSMLSALPLIGTLLPIPAPMRCDHPIDSDAGADDAGS